MERKVEFKDYAASKVQGWLDINSIQISECQQNNYHN